jgi:hypothetical protein
MTNQKEAVMKTIKYLCGFSVWLALLAVSPATGASACGGFFCTNVPVDQAAERIIFAVNDDGTIDAFVQINYTGSPDAFAWVVPVPNPPKLDTATMAMLRELDRLTQPVYMAPPLSDSCRNSLRLPMAAQAPAPGARADSSVTVFSQGDVGPFNYAVIGSDDPKAMVNWLRENKYQITEAMEPFIDVYIKEQMVFLAMKLQPKKEVRDIVPIKMTYKSLKPMIPLRLTAVAANPNMIVLTWILAKTQAEPENYAVVKVPDTDIIFFAFGNHNYQQLASQRLAEHKGRAFITEYAGPATRFSVQDPALRALLSRYAYLTRVYTRISPQDMTIDPVFKFNAALPDVSNVHDLSRDPNRVWDCNTMTNRYAGPVEVAVSAATNNYNPIIIAIYIAGGCVTLALGFVGVALFFGLRRRA